MPRNEPQMTLIELDLSSLSELGEGAAFRQVQILLAQAVADCKSRPVEKAARKLNIQFALKPRIRLEEYGDGQTRTVLDGISLSIAMDVVCPKRKTLDYDCGITDGNGLVFNPQAPHNHRQAAVPTLDDEDGVAGRVG